MEKLNNESDVSRETTENENEIVIVFKDLTNKVVSTHRREVNNLEDDLKKAKSYAVNLLKTYDKPGYAIIYLNDKYITCLHYKTFGLTPMKYNNETIQIIRQN